MKRKRKEYRLCFYLDNEQEKYIVEKLSELQNGKAEKTTSKEIFFQILYRYFKYKEQSESREKERTTEWYIQQIYEMLRNYSSMEELERKAPGAVKQNEVSSEEILSSGVMKFINSMIE